MGYLKKYIFWPLWVVLTTLTEVSPGDAQSNISAWAELFYNSTLPNFLYSEYTDIIIQVILIFSALAWVLFYLLKKMKLKDSFGNYLLNKLYGIDFFDDNYSIRRFGYTISRPHDLCLVSHINLKMFNHKNKPLVIKRAYLRSLVTGDMIDGYIENCKAEKVQLNEKKSARLYFKFPNKSGHLADDTIKGLTLEQFENKFSYFEIVIETDRKNFKFNYDKNITRKWVTDIYVGLMRPAPTEKAAVTPLV